MMTKGAVDCVSVYWELCISMRILDTLWAKLNNETGKSVQNNADGCECFEMILETDEGKMVEDGICRVVLAVFQCGNHKCMIRLYLKKEAEINTIMEVYSPFFYVPLLSCADT